MTPAPTRRTSQATKCPSSQAPAPNKSSPFDTLTRHLWSLPRKAGARGPATIVGSDQGRDMERERHSRAPSSTAGLDRTRAAAHRLPPGNQGVAGPDPGMALRAGRLLVLL